MKRLPKQVSLFVSTLLLVLVCGGPLMAGGLVERDFNATNFPDPANIDNEYWPLIQGTVFTYFAETDDGCEWNVVDVTTDDSTYIAGVKVVVVLDLEWLDEADECSEGDWDPASYDPGDPFNPANFPPGDLTEFTYDWYAQDIAPDDGGYVWYLGEATLSFDFEEGECDADVVPFPPFGDGCPDGSFEAGVDGAEAGIVMLADPQKGQFYQQEYYEENAEDWGKVLNFVPIDDEECLKTKEWTPLEPGEVEHKYYCPEGDGLELIVEVSGGPKVYIELIDVADY